MKFKDTFFTIGCVLALAAPALACGGIAINGTVYTDPGTPVTVGAGQDFLIALPGNRTTGYVWTAKTSNSNCRICGSAYESQPLPPGRTIVGAGGQQFFVVNAVHTGTATVTFSYGRPWQKGTLPARTESFTIKITR